MSEAFIVHESSSKSFVQTFTHFFLVFSFLFQEFDFRLFWFPISRLVAEQKPIIQSKHLTYVNSNCVRLLLDK